MIISGTSRFCWLSWRLRSKLRERRLSVLLAKTVICKFPSGMKTNLLKLILCLQDFMIAAWLKEILRGLRFFLPVRYNRCLVKDMWESRLLLNVMPLFHKNFLRFGVAGLQAVANGKISFAFYVLLRRASVLSENWTSVRIYERALWDSLCYRVLF